MFTATRIDKSSTNKQDSAQSLRQVWLLLAFMFCHLKVYHRLRQSAGGIQPKQHLRMTTFLRHRQSRDVMPNYLSDVSADLVSFCSCALNTRQVFKGDQLCFLHLQLPLVYNVAVWALHGSANVSAVLSFLLGWNRFQVLCDSVKQPNFAEFKGEFQTEVSLPMPYSLLP